MGTTRLTVDGLIQRVLLKKIEFCISRRMPGVYLQDASMETYLDHEADAMVAQFRARLYGQEYTDTKHEKDHIDFPYSWFQMFKRDCLPGWVLDRFPVRNRVHPFIRKVVTNTTKICPHINVKSDRDHLEWVISRSENTRKDKKGFAWV
jgi:hypothetical protein